MEPAILDIRTPDAAAANAGYRVFMGTCYVKQLQAYIQARIRRGEQTFLASLIPDGAGQLPGIHTVNA